MNHGLMRLAMVYCLYKMFQASQGDVQAAFLQAFMQLTKDSSEVKSPAPEKPTMLYVKLPLDLPPEIIKLGLEPGGIYPIIKAMYGLAESPRLFTQQFKDEAKKGGWVEIAESILIHTKDNGSNIDGVMFMHMDDLMNLAEKPTEMLQELDKRFKMGKIEEIKSDAITVYTGLDIKWDPKNKRCEIGQDRYINSIKTDLTDKEKRRRFGPSDLKLTEDKDVDMKFQQAQQAWTGVLGWAAKTQRQLSVVFGELSRNGNRPSRGSVLSTQRGCEYAKETCKPLVLEAISNPAIVVWVDASYSIFTCDGRLGWEIQVIDESEIGKDASKFPEKNVINWRSIRCKKKLASTTSAELCALIEGVKAVPAYTSMCEKLWGKMPKVIFVTDNQPLLAWLRTGWVESDPHMQGTLELAKSRIDGIGATVLWVDTANQRADKHTKFIYSK